MKFDSEIKLKDYTNELKKIHHYRRKWLYASSIVYTASIFLIFGWDYVSSLNNRKIWWVISSLSILISINWWYWTMRSLLILIQSMYYEYALLSEITYDIKELKQIFKDMHNSGK